MFSNMSILQMCERSCCPQPERYVVQMDGRDLQHCGLHVRYLHEKATIAEGSLWRNHKKKDCGEATRRSRRTIDKASRQGTPQDWRKGDILRLTPQLPRVTEPTARKRRFPLIFFLNFFPFYLAGIRLTTGGFTFRRIL